MKFPWNKKNREDKVKKFSDTKINKVLDKEEVNKKKITDVNKNKVNKNEKKFRFNDALYDFDTLPESAKQTLSLLTKSDKLIKLYKEKVDILNFTKRSLNESLKRSLKAIEESNSIAN